MILSFAFAGLFLVGNNVLGNSGGTGDLDDTPGIQLYKHRCSNYHNYWECRLGVTHLTCDTWSSC